MLRFIIQFINYDATVFSASTGCILMRGVLAGARVKMFVRIQVEIVVDEIPPKFTIFCRLYRIYK